MSEEKLFFLDEWALLHGAREVALRETREGLIREDSVQQDIEAFLEAAASRGEIGREDQ
jgi:hypothetical protein